MTRSSVTASERATARLGRDAWTRLRTSIGRHPRDAVSVLVALVLVAVCGLVARTGVLAQIDVALFNVVARFPLVLRPLWMGLAWVGFWPGIVAVAAISVYARRVRLGFAAAAAGVAAWAGVLGVHALLGAWSAPRGLVPALGSAPSGVTFPVLETAVATALMTVAGPYLRPAAHRAGWVVVVLVGIGTVFLGFGLPLGACGGGLLGWAVGSLAHLVSGAPQRKTTGSAVHRALEEAGFAPTSVTPLKHQRLGTREVGLLGPRQFLVDTAHEGTLRAEVIARLHRRAGLLFTVRRFLAALDAEDDPPLASVQHEVEHEAFVTLLAERAGVRTPQLVVACRIAHGSPLLVRREVSGRRLSQLPAGQVTDALLAAIWAQATRLSGARIAHHNLNARNILVDDAQHPWLLDFTFSRAGADQRYCTQELAEVLVTLAAVVGEARAVASGCRALGTEQLEAMLAYLRPLALPRAIRTQLDRARDQLASLRETLAARIDRPLPGFRSPVRVTTVAGLLLIGAAVYLLAPELASMRGVFGALQHANWGWLVATVVIGLVAIVMSAVSLLGSSPTRLPFWRTLAVQLAAAFTGRTTPGGAGFFGINIAFLEKLGIRRSNAVGITILNLAATGFTGAVCCVFGVFAVGTTGVLAHLDIPTGWPVWATVSGILLAAAATIASPFGRRKLVRPGLRTGKELLATLHHPLRALALFGGATAYHLVSACGLVTSLAALQPHVPLLGVLTAFVVGQTLGHMVPSPGGLGAVEALTIAGLTAVSVSATAAVTAVLTARLLTYWLPVLPGIAVFRYLQHHQRI